jgi:hypothetical protein
VVEKLILLGPTGVVTAPPSVCVSAVLVSLAVWIQNPKKKKKSPVLRLCLRNPKKKERKDRMHLYASLS